MAGGVTVFNPATQQVVEMPAADAQKGFVAGKLHLPNDGKIYMTHEDGTTKVFPTTSAGQALDQGWSFSLPEQIAAKKVDVSPLQQGIAAAEGGLSSLTFGYSDAVEKQSGVDQAMMRARRESTAGKAGEYTGLGVQVFGDGLLKLAGEGIVKSGLEKALLPSLGVSAIGDGVEQMAKKALGDSLTDSAVARVAAAGIGRATEGAVIGFGQQLSEESLGDPDVNVGNLMAGAGMGALVGGVAGVGLRGLTEWRADMAYKAGREAMKNSIGQKGVYGIDAPTVEQMKTALEASTGTSWSHDAVKKWVNPLNEGLDKMSELAGYDPNDLAAARSEVVQKWLRQGKQSLEGEARKFADVINDVSAEQKASSEEYFGRLKPQALELIPKGSEASVISRAGDAIAELRAIRDRAVDDYAVLGFKSPEHAASKFENMDALLSRVEDRVFKAAGVERNVVEKTIEKHPLFDREAVQLGREADAAIENGNPAKVPVDMGDVPLSMSRERTVTKKLGLKELAESRTPLPEGLSKQVFEELNAIKQQLAKPANYARAGEISDRAQMELEKRFQQAHSTLQDHLESTEVWGKMGDVQREMNRAWKARNDAFGKLRQQIKFDSDGRVDPQGLQNYLNKVDKFRGDAASDALDQWHQAHGVYADAIDKHFSEAGVGEKARELGKRFVGVREDIENGVKAFNTVQRLIGRRYQQYGGSGLGGGLLGGAVGAAFGPAGAVGGVIAQQGLAAVLDPGRRALNMANLANLMDKVAPWIDKRAEALVKGKEAGRRAITGPFGQRVIAKTTLAIIHAKNAEERRDAYHARVEELRRLANPDSFADHVSSQLVGFSDHLPNHGRAITAHAVNAVNYLLATLPLARPGTTGNGGAFDSLFSRPTPHDRDIKKWGDTDHAIQDPMSVVDDAHRGYVTEHKMRAVETVHPQFTKTLRSSLVTHAGRLATPPLTKHSRVLNQLLGGAAADPGMLGRAQAVHKALAGGGPRAGAAQGGPKVKTSRSATMRSQSDSLETYPLK